MSLDPGWREHIIDVYISSSSNGMQQLQRGRVVSDCCDGPGKTETTAHSGNGAWWLQPPECHV